jgi:hypothetical protein
MKQKIILGVVFISLSGFASSQSWTPSVAEITKLESAIKLDKLAYWKISHLPPLVGYERYYAGSTLRGEKMIFGELVAPWDSKQKPGIHVVARKHDFPVIMDGGCGIINLVYSVKEQRIVSIQCNLDA